MTIKNLNLRVCPTRRSATYVPKYSLFGRELTLEREREMFVAQDERFCSAMRKAIAAGLERPVSKDD